MNQSHFSIAIATIGRSSLNDAILSCVDQGVPVVVVSDGFDLEPNRFPTLTLPNVKFYKLGQNYGKLNNKNYYGQIAHSVGVLLSETPFSCTMGDDDELINGGAEVINRRIQETPEIDIWIPGLRHKDGWELCISPKFAWSNVSHPVYRTTVLASVPIYHVEGIDQANSDYHHLDRCRIAGYKFGWIGQPCINLRPKLPGRNGCGQL